MSDPAPIEDLAKMLSLATAAPYTGPLIASPSAQARLLATLRERGATPEELRAFEARFVSQETIARLAE